MAKLIRVISIMERETELPILFQLNDLIRRLDVMELKALVFILWGKMAFCARWSVRCGQKIELQWFSSKQSECDEKEKFQMDKILDVRTRIHDQFHDSNAGSDYFFKEDHAAKYAAYYTAMYLIADTGESIWTHMKRGFSCDPHLAYIEFWGVMQAIFIQQDAIKELYESVVGSELKISKTSDWWKIRDVRNLCAGHPSKRTRGVPATQRTFMGRSFGEYSNIQYELWDVRTPHERSHPSFNLSAMISAYDAEGARILEKVLRELARKWP